MTAACNLAGLPAVAVDTDGHLISQVVACKLEASEKGKERLHAILTQVREAGFQFVYDFDKFGEKGESSYIAVIHTDGNSMGKRFAQLAEDHLLAKHNPDYVKTLRKIVRLRVNTPGPEAALNATVNTLLASWDTRTELSAEWAFPHLRSVVIVICHFGRLSSAAMTSRLCVRGGWDWH